LLVTSMGGSNVDNNDFTAYMFSLCIYKEFKQ
jgi:hypothetical protein